MAFTVTENCNIICPRGDTGAITYAIRGIDMSEGDVLVFGVIDNGGRTILRKIAAIENGAAIINFSNADTRELDVGKYRYNLRLVTDPEYDGDGNVICLDDTDNVITLYNCPPRFVVTEVCVNV